MRQIPPAARHDGTRALATPRAAGGERRLRFTRLRLTVAVAFLLVAGTLVLELSGTATRLAGTDHVSEQGFLAAIPGGRELCQSKMVLPQQSRTLQILLSTRGRPVPELLARFLSSDGQVIATGRLNGGARQGWVYIPLAQPVPMAVSGALCIKNAGRTRVVLAGEPFTPDQSSTRLAGRPVRARFDLLYLRAGRESWWQLLPALSQRFGLGKSALFGSWTLPLLVLMLVLLWVATARLLTRELT